MFRGECRWINGEEATISSLSLDYCTWLIERRMESGLRTGRVDVALGDWGMGMGMEMGMGWGSGCSGAETWRTESVVQAQRLGTAKSG